MKKLNHLIFAVILAVSLFSCKKTKVTDLNTTPFILDSGTIVFYSDDYSPYAINIVMQGIDIGSLQNAVSTIPACGANNTITIKWPIGNYQYQGFMLGDKLWQENITVKKDSCIKVFLNKGGNSSIIMNTAVDSFFRFVLNGSSFSYKFPWVAKYTGDPFTTTPIICEPYFNSGNTLRIVARDDYKENQIPYSVPQGFGNGPSSTLPKVELKLNLTGRPIARQQFNSCSSPGQLRIYFCYFSSASSHYGYYGFKSPGDYFNVTITNVTGNSVSGIFQGSLTKFRVQNGQTIIMGRGEITQGFFKTKYLFY